MTFLAYRNEGGADFRKWCEANPDACLRRFQVRTTGEDRPPKVTNGDVDERHATFTIEIAYPQTQRFGDEAALDRDDAIDEDMHTVERVVGIYGRENFTPPGPDACWRSAKVRRENGAGVDFLIVEQVMSYQRHEGTLPGDAPITYAAATASAIRGRVLELVVALVPAVLPADAFLAFRNEGAGDFPKWCTDNPDAALRRVQARTAQDWPTSSPIAAGVEARRMTVEVFVAYPQTERFGDALRRDDAMDLDRRDIEHAIGSAGYANFTGAHPNARLVEAASRFDRTDGIDFLVISQTFEYYRIA